MSFDIHIDTHEEEAKLNFRKVAIAFLHEACGELVAQVRNNQRVKTGKTRRSWKYEVDTVKLCGYVASDSMNAVYEEFGTGEYALSGNGRKGGWWYRDENNKLHFTLGKKPHRPLYRAYTIMKPKIIAWAEAKFRSLQ